MATSALNTVITDLVDDMQNKISIDNGYLTDPYVIKGATPVDKVRRFPCIMFVPVAINRREFIGDSRISDMDIMIVGVARATKDENNTEEVVLNLYDDTIKYLDTESSLSGQIHNIGLNANFFGNKTTRDNIFGFEISFNISVEQTV